MYSISSSSFFAFRVLHWHQDQFRICIEFWPQSNTKQSVGSIWPWLMGFFKLQILTLLSVLHSNRSHVFKEAASYTCFQLYLRDVAKSN